MPDPSSAPPPGPRHASIDALRGLIIVLMTLDHVRGFFTPAGASPTDLATTTPLFFAMRWVTHLCAPGFVFLMGVAAALRHDRRPAGTADFLLRRGLWLILLEATWVSVSWSWSWSRTSLGVLWALGAGMLGLVPFTRLPRWTATAAGLGLTLLFAVLPVDRATVGLAGWLQPGDLTLLGHPVWASYALLPWMAVAMVGWGLARGVARARPGALLGWGAGLVGLGLALRLANLGDPAPWAPRATTVSTVLAVLKLSKYPPSLTYLLVTLGLDLALLAGLQRLERTAAGVFGWLRMLGQVPMFFYLVHLPLAHLLGNAWALALYGTGRIPRDAPLSLALVLAATALTLALLTPACAAWRRLKQRRPDVALLRYL